MPSGIWAKADSGRLLPVRDTRLWVDDSGPRDAPVLVYMHGGPGVGALEFETYMKPALADRVRLISIDQRGVLRSDPIAKDAKISVADLVADFEAVRAALGIARWQVLGHSFGGMLAMHYALAHPDRVSRLSLENPAYDAAASGHWVAAATAQALNGASPEAAVAADRLADRATVVDPTFFDKLGPAMAALGDRRQDLYVVQAKHRDMFSRLATTSGLPDARWEQGQIPGLALLKSPDFYTPMIPRVQGLKMPILYVRGSGDHTTSPEEIAALLAAGARMETVANAGHFIHVEEPAELADLLAS
ncbi:alpha/beta fold hydrolase [Sphingomonas japonica]|uniref:alpha/beta fold hydrolase n=1 Tax=Sphingomonas japonica TaxID=511662 RepID=UPI002444AB5D|nr:alpha/beta hydrolase [Sphingomonas japonica]